MSAEQIFKFQPDRTMYLRGFTGFGAAASLSQASPAGFEVCGVFRDMADFCVLVLYDADNTFEHYSVRYLPDFDVSGITLSFDLTYQGLQPIDSAKYSWIDWSQMDVVKVDPNTGNDIIPPAYTTFAKRLWDYATLTGGTYSVAQGTYHITTPGNCRIYDRITLIINDIGFDFASATGGESAAYVAKTLADSVNSRDWSTYENNTVSVVIASADDSGNLILKNGRTGHVAVNGTQVTWQDGTKFPGIAPGSAIYLGGTGYVVSAVRSPTLLTLVSAAPSSDQVVYLAEYGGADGNSVTSYMVVRPGNQTLGVDKTVLQLSGGNSDGVTWNISLDFSALGLDSLRQAWLTFAPQLTTGADYVSTEWTASFTNWNVTSKFTNTALQCAGRESVRVGNDEKTACCYSGSGWSVYPANNYWHGFARQTSSLGDAVSVTYSCAATHDLYLGTTLDTHRGTLTISLDGDQETKQDCYLPVSSEVVGRRLLRKDVAPGTHTVTVTLTAVSPNAQVAGSIGLFPFDFLEAAVRSDVADPLVTYSNVSPALDYDTDATYKVSPARLLWHLCKLGFAGQINEYIGVFWWNQRKRIDSIWNSVIVTFSGSWAAGDVATLSFDSVGLTKTVTTWDTLETIGAHFVYYINAGSIIVRAATTGTGQLTIWTRTPNWQVSFATSFMSISGLLQTHGVTYDQALNTFSPPGSPTLTYGKDGSWQVDASAPNPLNVAVSKWHQDLYASAKERNLLVTTSFSMELVNPPADDNTAANTWCARYQDGTIVETATGFSNLTSTQCVPVPNLTAFQAAAFTAIAELQSEAGLTPWLQFGEFLWWFFSSVSQAIGYCSYTNPISIGLANAHGMQTGDRVVISGVRGCEAANGTWSITVTDPTHFTIPVSASGQWEANSGLVRGGSMAFYDAATAIAASGSLGRPLYKFTCQDDDPTVNQGSDAAFLAGQLKAHVDGIRNAVLTEYPDTHFEILFPNDVNHPVCYLGPNVPYPQGGRLNAAVNLPSSWMTKPGSGLDRFKVEALSWGAQYLNLTLANQAMNLALTSPFSWQPADVAYLVPWFNGTCPWDSEYHSASTRGVGLINFWAYDHLALMSWPLPFVPPVRRSFRKS